MPRQFISLREVGRRLGVPPSTIVYYKDRFAPHIPSLGGAGRRRRYPVEVLEIFRRIREMYNNNWSTEQIDEELTKTGEAVSGEAHRRSSVEPGAFRPMSMDQGVSGALLEKVSDLLDSQTLFRSEIRTLRDEVAALREERDQAEARQKRRIADLEKELAGLRSTSEKLQRAVSRGTGGLDFPSKAFLERPLVVRNQGEYLGVLGKGKTHFSLGEFVRLIQQGAKPGHDVDMTWERLKRGWTLNISAKDAKGAEQNILLVAQKTVTPSNNTVTEILRLNIGGNDVPDALLLSLFKKVREGFTG